MRIHRYDRDTREYQLTEDWTPPHAWVALPADAVAAEAVPLPETRMGFARVLTVQADSWEYAEDHRGEQGWKPDGQAHTIVGLGPLPDGWSTSAPVPSPENVAAYKAREIRTGYDTALAGVLAGAEATATGVAVGSALMAVTDPEGLEYLVERLTARRVELEQVLLAAQADADPVAAVLAIVVSYPT
ncbi:hypothetical protein [Nitratidesulfovibrio liaohensis]|uniref:hypothetical protein n=1 Tax=Nitratidesulfovibrio liaohensis TaxID=2604158 RepID=UPI00141E06CB|nr:hypothetical protein [Nitratidesulfovibrio liaohensis]NHZ45508.1 hypothetical protein [Nitratidesulfovibrio liaohensis]